MKNRLQRLHAKISRARKGKDRGVALLLALLMLVMMSALAIIMVMVVSPDMMINGYYGNYRGSFYAADSGLSIARQQLANQTMAAVNTTPCADWGATSATGCTSDPLTGFNGATVLNNVMTSYANFSSLTSGQAANSWPGNFEIKDNNPTCINSYASAGAPQTTVTAGKTTGYQYTFNYKLCAVGRAAGLTQNAGQVVTSESGAIQISVAARTTGNQVQQQSFAGFGYFVDNYPVCSAPLVQGTMTGPLFTNGQWQYGSGTYIFTDNVKQQNPKAGYWIGGTCYQSTANQYTSGGTTVKPTFQQGLSLGQTAASTPTNDFSQKWAVIDGKGCGEGSNVCSNPLSPDPPAVQNSDMHNALMNSAGTPYPSGGAATGVFMPYGCTGGPPCVNTIDGGGILVEGNASVVLSTGNDASGNPTQIYSITQGGTTTTITTNVAANTTNFNGTILRGVPQNLSGVSASPATMLYVDGKITGLRGPSETAPAVNDGVALTVTAASDVDITGNLLYKTKPVTADASDALISGNDHNQTLGVFTNGGNIVLSTPYSSQDLEVDGSIAALGPNGSSWLTANHIDTLTIMGGRITSNISGIDVSTRNVFFDRRYSTRTDGFAPPWFPSTTITTTGTINPITPLVQNRAQRLSWVTTPQ